MGLVTPQAKREHFRDLILSDAGSLTLHLFNANVTPTDLTLITDLTECTFGGYASTGFSGPSNSYGSGRATAGYGDQAFICTSGTDTVYGYYVTDGSGNLLWAERDPSGPFSISAGQTYTVTPVFEIGNL